MPLYKITFTDDSIFLGGDTIENSKWGEIPDKDILCLEYFLSDGSSIVLKDFEKYAAFTEATNNFLKNSGVCGKCGKLGKIIAAKLKNSKGEPRKRYLIKCLDKECDYVTKIMPPKETKSSHELQYKYVMGLKDNIVTSYRISLNGIVGKDRHCTGDITVREYEKGKEFRGKPIADFAWKRGIR